MEFSDVIVVFGGASSERLVSVASAQHVLAVLEGAQPWFEAPDGHVFACAPAEVAAHLRAFELDFTPSEPARWPSLLAALDAAEARGRTFFLAYHGTGGEDGTVQRLLEQRGLAFTGSGSHASAKAFDKTWAKRLAREHGVLCAEEVLLPRGDPEACRAALAGLITRHGRAVAKPVSGGSSVGLHHVIGMQDVEWVAAAAAGAAEEYLAEQFIAGTELTVGVVDGPAGARALPCSEVRVDPGRSFDYEGKYLGKGTTEVTPAQVAASVSAAAQQLSLAVHAALGCTGYSRTDVIVGPRGPVFLEINTLPGLTRMSFIPQQLAAEGTSMLDFLSGQLELARSRLRR